MIWVIVLLLSIIIISIIARKVLSADSKTIIKILKTLFVFILVFIIIFIAIKFGFHFLSIIPAFILFLFRSYLFNLIRGNIFNLFQSNQYRPFYNNSHNSNNSSKIDTSTLCMTLNHSTGEIDGYIKMGKFKDKTLNDLSIDDLLALRDECLENDKDALRLIEAYLDRTTDFDWKSKTNNYYKSTDNEGFYSDSMTIKEAYQILGLDDTADKEKIKETYQSLISKLHPDKGGSDYLASKINQAKDILLNKK